MTEKLLKVSDVGELLDLKPARIYELCREKRENQLPFILIGERQYRFSFTAVMDWISKGGNKKSEVNEDE